MTGTAMASSAWPSMLAGVPRAVTASIRVPGKAQRRALSAICAVIEAVEFGLMTMIFMGRPAAKGTPPSASAGWA